MNSARGGLIVGIGGSRAMGLCRMGYVDVTRWGELRAWRIVVCLFVRIDRRWGYNNVLSLERRMFRRDCVAVAEDTLADDLEVRSRRVQDRGMYSYT
jgi:hypothetical protein